MELISFIEFNSFGIVEKQFYLEEYGANLDQFYFTGDKKLWLFSLFSYYVAVCYDSQNNISEAIAFGNDEKLDPYLNQVDIKPLFASL